MAAIVGLKARTESVGGTLRRVSSFGPDDTEAYSGDGQAERPNYRCPLRSFFTCGHNSGEPQIPQGQSLHPTP
jgi:hypothetical protein